MPRFRDIKPFVRGACYHTTTQWYGLEAQLKSLSERILPDGGGIVYDGLNLCPDYQRGHVWTDAQKIAYVEYAMRGGASGRAIYFNNPTWGTTYSAPTEIVDGLQRLTAVRDFLAGKIPAFGHLFGEYTDRISLDWYFDVYVHNLQTRAEILQWYLGINSGGTPHQPGEIARVQALLDAELAKPLSKAKPTFA